MRHDIQVCISRGVVSLLVCFLVSSMGLDPGECYFGGLLGNIVVPLFVQSLVLHVWEHSRPAGLTCYPRRDGRCYSC